MAYLCHLRMKLKSGVRAPRKTQDRSSLFSFSQDNDQYPDSVATHSMQTILLIVHPKEEMFASFHSLLKN